MSMILQPRDVGESVREGERQRECALIHTQAHTDTHTHKHSNSYTHTHTLVRNAAHSLFRLALDSLSPLGSFRLLRSCPCPQRPQTRAANPLPPSLSPVLSYSYSLSRELYVWPSQHNNSSNKTKKQAKKRQHSSKVAHLIGKSWRRQRSQRSQQSLNAAR